MRTLVTAICGLIAGLVTTPALAQTEQFVPLLVYRTGPYAVNGVPYANGVVDYYNLVNARDGGINGVKLSFEECETGYATDKGVECYERLKTRGSTGAAFFNPLSTGITFALTERTWTDKIPLITMGYGRADSKNGAVFKWNFPLLGTYWTAADIAIKHIAKEVGGDANLQAKKIALLYHDSPYGKEPIPALQILAKKFGFELSLYPVTHPGLEQKSQWLSIRHSRPDYVLIWGWGVMNGTAIKEAAAVAYPRDKMLGVWWSGAEPDVEPAGDQAIGYKSLMLQHGAGKFAVHADIEKYVYAKGNGATDASKVGEVLYNRGLVNAMLGVEAIRTAQEKFGNKPLTGEQIQWGLEHLNLSAERIKALGFEGMLRPLHITCADHEGARSARVQQWDGKKWNVISDWYSADQSIVQPLVERVSSEFAKENNITPRDCGSAS
jgi:branched-chain amino acid transport system substrate-binding protein